MSTRNLTAVEGLRFFLFVGIFVFHCVNYWLPIGWCGVEAFLVIGSFFLTNKYLKDNQKDINVFSALFKRIKRLYPVYVSIIVLAILLTLIKKTGNPMDSIWYIFSAQNFRCLFDGDWVSLDSLLGHFWYIALDVWLFLIWILLLRIVPRKYYRISFIVAISIGIGWRTTLLLLKPENISLAYVIPLGMLDSFAIGGLVALNVKEKGNNDKIMWFDILIGCIGVILVTLYNAFLHKCSVVESYQLYHNATGYMHNPITGNTYFFVALFFAGVLRYCINTDKKHPILSSAPLVTLGGMTYELYCFHFPILTITQHFVTNKVIILVVVFLASLVVSYLWNKWTNPIIKKIIN